MQAAQYLLPAMNMEKPLPWQLQMACLLKLRALRKVDDVPKKAFVVVSPAGILLGVGAYARNPP